MNLQITPQTSVADLLSAWPEAVPVFLNRRMACVGCNMSRFETLQDASRIYGVNLETFLEEIARTISQAKQGPKS
jgi:hybrid cluster-associated redox disulfide protein